MVFREHHCQQDEHGESGHNVTLRLFGHHTFRHDALVANSRGYRFRLRRGLHFRDLFFLWHRLLSLPLEGEPVLADFEITLVHDLGEDVSAILELKGNQVGLAVFSS